MGDGGRSCEVPWITEKLKGVEGKVICDFGCETGKETYGVDLEKNEYRQYDLNPAHDGIIQANLITGAGMPDRESVDTGICVSVVEHLGLDCYNQKTSLYGDLVALGSMLRRIKTGGILYVTVPFSVPGYFVRHWIKSYSPLEIQLWQHLIVGRHDASIDFETFKKSGLRWIPCYDAKEFFDLKHYGVGEDIIGIACITIQK